MCFLVDVDTNFPLKTHSGDDESGYMENSFTDVLPGAQPESLYNLDVSKCTEKKMEEAGQGGIVGGAKFMLRMAAGTYV